MILKKNFFFRDYFIYLFLDYYSIYFFFNILIYLICIIIFLLHFILKYIYTDLDDDFFQWFMIGAVAFFMHKGISFLYSQIVLPPTDITWFSFFYSMCYVDVSTFTKDKTNIEFVSKLFVFVIDSKMHHEIQQHTFSIIYPYNLADYFYSPRALILQERFDPTLPQLLNLKSLEFKSFLNTQDFVSLSRFINLLSKENITTYEDFVIFCNKHPEYFYKK